MAEYGLTDDGIESPSYNALLNYLAQRWKEEFGKEVDLSSNTAEGQVFRIVASIVSNKGLEWMEFESLWDFALDIYFSAYVSTASGISLDYSVDRRGLTRKSQRGAQGVVVFQGSEGQEIPINTIVKTPSGTEFTTTRDAIVGPYGIVAVPTQAVESGVEGNVVAGTITNSDTFDVSNPNDTHIRILGSTIDTWDIIPNDSSLDHYQLFDPQDIKYITNLYQLKLPIKAKSAGLYAFKLKLLNHDSGKVIYQTETTEVNLAENEQKEVTFTGEGFDLGQSQIGDTVRIAVQNHDYSVDNMLVALDDQQNYKEWYHGTAGQHKSLKITLTSQVKGHFTGGREAETDEELRARYQKELNRGGTNRAASIESELYEIPGVKHAQVYENNSHRDLRDLGGLPPHSIEAVTWGGAKEDIMKVLLSERSAGTQTWGNRIGTITDDQNQTHTMRWSRAEEVDLYIDIELVIGANFPANGAEQVKDTCAKIVGGENTKGAFLDGVIGVGETVYQSGIESALHDEINGLRSVSILMGTSANNLIDGDVEIDNKQTAVVRPKTINIIT